MPRISYFHGLAIYMYWNEAGHAVPHFHVVATDGRASVDLRGGLIAGSLPGAARRLLEQWCGLHHQELLANWERARRAEPLLEIAPLE